jgi:hypothetical protein
VAEAERGSPPPHDPAIPRPSRRPEILFVLEFEILQDFIGWGVRIECDFLNFDDISLLACSPPGGHGIIEGGKVRSSCPVKRRKISRQTNHRIPDILDNGVSLDCLVSHGAEQRGEL